MALKEKGIAAEFLSSTQNSQVRNKVVVGIKMLILQMQVKNGVLSSGYGRGNLFVSGNHFSYT